MLIYAIGSWENPMKYMSIVDMRHMQLRKKKKEVYFDASNLHNRICVSDAKLKIISQNNMEDRLFHY